MSSVSTRRWDVIKGNDAFFAVTKAFHNALHGGDETITADMLEVFRETTKMNLDDLGPVGDFVVIHDPQPAGLIARRAESGGHWLWRCHIDVSTPEPQVWDFLRPYVEQYDGSVFSHARVLSDAPDSAVHGAPFNRPP